MEQDRIRVHPPGPFPPSGTELPGEVDLGIRLRDTLYRRAVVLDARKALYNNIKAAARSPQQVMMALPAIDAFIDTFPLAAMIEDAVAQWKQQPDARSLTILARAADVIGSVLGWPRSVDRRWPLPDQAWMRRQVTGPAVVVPRGPRDGAPATAVALDAVLGLREALPLPKMVSVHGDDLTERADDLCAALRLGVASAVDVAGWIPWDDDSQAALARLSNATPLQLSYSQCGLASLVAGGGGRFADLLQTAPAGTFGDRLRAACEVVVVPHLNDEGVIDTHGVLVWDDHYRSVRVSPVVGTVIEALRDPCSIETLSSTLESDPAIVEDVVRQLIEVGAITAC